MDTRTKGGGTLPWGWWLRASTRGLEDDNGIHWQTVREAFWQGKLGFPESHFAKEQLELLLRVLTAIGSRWSNGGENRHDLFGGDMLFWRFYLGWLSSVGLLAKEGRLGLEAPLTELGSSVMLMLQATRDPDWVDLPMEAVVDAVRHSGRDAPDEARRRALSAFEREVAGRPHVFAREQIHRSHLITLTGVAVGARLPTRRITWSQSFTDESARDDFFGWLAERTDRWDDWGQLAYSKGAKRLTEHFLTLVIGAGVTPS
jgi:hypothetical protein